MALEHSSVTVDVLIADRCAAADSSSRLLWNIMSEETLRSGAFSCSSLAAGVDASAQLAGLKLQSMSGDEIKDLLKDWFRVPLTYPSLFILFSVWII